MLRSLLSTSLLIALSACGSTTAGSVVHEADDTQEPERAPEVDALHEADEEADVVELAPRMAPVQAGSYRLRLTASCEAKELSATGVLTLRPIAGAESPKGVAAADAGLLWGQADLDLERLKACLRGPLKVADEPIHPSLFAEVLKWDGEPRRPVLLVSTEARRKGKSRAGGVGIAMWVERVDAGHMAGFWSRWELMGREEGRWEAELVTPL